jgi:hypothetical protein
MILRSLPVAVLMILAVTIVSQAQVYRPAQRWMQMDTPHFRVLYSMGQDSLARATGRILESQYLLTSKLTGGKLKRFPVILNDYNDRSNGYVSPLLFRTEIEVAPIKGKNLSPRTGGWLETVLPHELVHAQHMNVMPAPGLSWAFSLLSPDIGRGMNTFAHSGFLEGIAVYHESSLGVDGGRGNLSSFLYEFDTNWRGEANSRRWGLGTALSPSGASHPGSRHYMGGYQYSAWLVHKYGEKSIRDIIDFHSRWPFLGFGVANWAKTGDSPIQMKRSFNAWYDSTRIKHTLDKHQDETQIETNWTGARMRRPVWMDSETLLFHGSAYNQTSGFFRYQTSINEFKKILKTSIIEDFVYTYNALLNEIIYSVYEPHPFHENRYFSNIHRYSVEGEVGMKVVNSDRMHAPAATIHEIDALGYYRESSVWMRFNDSRWDTVVTIHPNVIVQIQPRPGTDEYAVIGNKNGLQAIWFIQKGSESDLASVMPDIRYSNGSVLDISWSDDGKRLLYSVDIAGGVQMHEFDVDAGTVTHLKSGRPLMLEPSLSPDNSKIAYVFSTGDQYLIGILPYGSFLRTTVPTNVWQADVAAHLQRERLGNHLSDMSLNWESKRYRGGLEWLKPRMVSPYATDDAELLDARYGVSIQSTELLRRHTYSFDVSTSNNRVWYDLTYRYSGLYPGFIISTGSEPQAGFLRTGNSIVPTLIDDSNTRISVPFRWLIKQNVETSLVQFRPEIQFRSIKAVDSKTGESLSDPRSIQTMRGYLVYAQGLEQALRDVQPRKGMVLYADGRQDLKTYLDNKGKALRAGVDMYAPVLSHKNHGLQIRTQILTQGGGLYFGSSTLHRNQFLNTPYLGERNLTNLQLRYAVPLIYPDRGSFLIPWYLESSWLVFFSNTVSPFGGQTGFEPFNESRTSFGVEWRFITGFPNFRINIGVGIGYEPLRNEYTIFIQ